MKKNVKKCFKNLHISKKSCIFASKFSNLCYIKVCFMNNKDQYVKYVYHHIHGNFYATSQNKRHFHLDFPRVHNLFTQDYATKVEILFRSSIPTTIWKDKHGNIIVRMLQPNKQTKIDF